MGATGAPPVSPNTVLDYLVDHLRSKDVPLDGLERPAAILWTDPEGEWRPLVEALQVRLDELLMLGDLNAAVRTGPAIWIRCLVDGTLDDPPLPEERTPIVYLPGVGRQELRAGEECRDELRPLVELMFRGTLWLQHNGSDWGVMTFLTSKKALGLDIARDNSTVQAMLRALPEVGATAVAQLEGRRLEADDFDRMLSGDVVRDLLRWMGDPDGTRARLGQSEWAAFCSRCREEFDFDPDVEADITAGERMGLAAGNWEAVWERFAESPTAYDGVEAVLRRSRPTTTILFDQGAREHWPDLNQEDEDSVRRALEGLKDLSHPEACDVIRELNGIHGERRRWVWARMGLSPVAKVLEPLARLADAVKLSIGGATPDEVAAAYMDRGWQADASAWEAISACPTADESLVIRVVRQLLGPWLDQSARAFQVAVEQSPLPGAGQQSAVEVGEGDCLVFADGLRYDLGERLSRRLEGRGCNVILGHRWAAVPTVTATGKPAVSPVASAIAGGALGEDFAPAFAPGAKPVNAGNLREAVRESGYQIFSTQEMGMPETSTSRGWTEAGEIDSLGHKLQGRVAGQIDEEIDRLADRVVTLLRAGWKTVRIVTDHGWLLLPGGLPKVDLPKHLVESRWSRCAVIAGDSAPDVMRVPWHWNATQLFATAPGVACFNTTREYAHGGISVQECLIPDIRVELSDEIATAAAITSITWRGLRCFLEVTATGTGVRADLRLERATGSSVAVAIKPVDEDGSVSLVLSGDEHEGDELVVVLIDDSDVLLTQRPTRVGVDS